FPRRQRYGIPSGGDRGGGIRGKRDRLSADVQHVSDAADRHGASGGGEGIAVAVQGEHIEPTRGVDHVVVPGEAREVAGASQIDDIERTGEAERGIGRCLNGVIAANDGVSGAAREAEIYSRAERDGVHAGGETIRDLTGRIGTSGDGVALAVDPPAGGSAEVDDVLAAGDASLGSRREGHGARGHSDIFVLPVHRDVGASRGGCYCFGGGVQRSDIPLRQLYGVPSGGDRGGGIRGKRDRLSADVQHVSDAADRHGASGGGEGIAVAVQGEHIEPTRGVDHVVVPGEAREVAGASQIDDIERTGEAERGIGRCLNGVIAANDGVSGAAREAEIYSRAERDGVHAGGETIRDLTGRIGTSGDGVALAVDPPAGGSAEVDDVLAAGDASLGSRREGHGARGHSDIFVLPVHRDVGASRGGCYCFGGGVQRSDIPLRQLYGVPSGGDRGGGIRGKRDRLSADVQHVSDAADRHGASGGGEGIAVAVQGEHIEPTRGVDHVVVPGEAREVAGASQIDDIERTGEAERGIGRCLNGVIAANDGVSGAAREAEIYSRAERDGVHAGGETIRDLTGRIGTSGDGVALAVDPPAGGSAEVDDVLAAGDASLGSRREGHGARGHSDIFVLPVHRDVGASRGGCYCFGGAGQGDRVTRRQRYGIPSGGDRGGGIRG